MDMKQALVALALAGLVGGCASSNSAPKPAGGATTAPAAKKGSDYFEVRKGGKVYVLGSMESLAAFNKGTMPAKTIEDATVAPGGLIAVFEATDMATYDRLMKEYTAQHKR